MSFPHDDASLPTLLGRLIHPVTASSFQERYWSRAPLRIHRSAPGYFADLLSSRDVDQLLAHAVTNDGIDLIKDERRTSLQRDAGELRSSLCEYYHLYAQGHTIEIQDLHLRRTSVGHFANTLSRELGFNTSIDAWVSPPNCSGLRFPLGERDAFVLQIEGSTTWDVASLPESGDGSSIADAPAQIHLLSGDTLYIPRGTIYQARTTDQHSLCWIIGVQVKTWADLLITAVEVISERELRLRRALAIGVLTHPDSKNISGEWNEIIALVCDGFTLEEARTKLSSDHKERLPPLPDGHFTQMQHVDGIGLETELEPRAGAASEMRFAYGAVEFLFPGGWQHGPEKLFLALDFIKSSKRFFVKDIPGWYSDQEKLRIVRYLVRKGYLRITDPRGGGGVEA